MPVETSKLSQRNSKYSHYSAHYYRGQMLYWIILLFVFISFALLPIIRVDVSVQSRGLVRTKHKISGLTSPVTAKVIHVNLEDNKEVFRGDTLLVLDQSGLISELKVNQLQVQLQESYLQDLGLLADDPLCERLSSPLYNQERIDYSENITKLERAVSKSRINFKRTSGLYLEGVVPLSAFQEDSFKLYELIDELQLFKTATHARWETERRNYTLALHELAGKVENLKHRIRQCYIIAPFRGSVIDFSGIAEGSFIPENDLIANLSPEDDLIAECYVSPADIGLIKNAMKVQLQIDAYNYNQWGLLTGNVVNVANDVSFINGAYVYIIQIKLGQEYLQLRNGIQGPLKKGMSLTGRFIVARRSLFQLLFDDMDDWLNPKIVKR